MAKSPQLDTDELRHVGQPLRRIDQVMEIAGIALFPLGITAILMGWAGASGTGWVFEQIPYMISGGMLGVGLLLAAGSLYMASWISRSAAWNRQQTQLLLSALEELKAAQGTVVVAADGGANGAPVATAGGFVATPRGSMFHTRDCSIVADRTDLREVTGTEAGMQPCGMCSPTG